MFGKGYFDTERDAVGASNPTSCAGRRRPAAREGCAIRSFDAIDVRTDPGTRQAVRLCRAVAALRPVQPQPVVLAGPSGTDKTRLLNLSAQTLRQIGADVLVACVSPHHFDYDVKCLPHVTAPFRGVQYAVLLIDAIERFTHELPALEAVVRLFLHQGDAVLVSSRCHPWGLENISEGLRLLLCGGQVISIAPPAREQTRRLGAETVRLLDATRAQAGVAATAAERLRAALDEHTARVKEGAALLAQVRRLRDADRDTLGELRTRLVHTRQMLRPLMEESREAQERGAHMLPVWRKQTERAVAMLHAAIKLADEVRVSHETFAAHLERFVRWAHRQRTELANLREHRRAAATEAAAVRALCGHLEATLTRVSAERTAYARQLQARLAADVVPAGSRQRRARQKDVDAAMRDNGGAALEKALAAQHTQHLRARMELDAFTEQSEHLTAQIEADRLWINKLDGRLAAQQEQVNTLTRDAEAARAEAETAQDLAARFRAAYHRVAVERDELRKQLHVAAAENRQVRRQLAELREHYMGLLEFAASQDAEEEALGAIVPFPPKNEKPRQRLGEMLCAAGKLTPRQLAAALEAQGRNPDARLGVILVENGFAGEEAVVEAVAQQCGLTFVRLDTTSVSPDVAGLIDAAAAREHQCLPVRAEGGELILALADPLNGEAVALVEKATRLRVRVVAASPRDIARAQETLYAA